MHPTLVALLQSIGVVATLELALALFLTFVTKVGAVGRAVGETFTRAPLLDIWVASLTWAPWVVASVAKGWAGLGGAIVGQMIAMGIWCVVHEMVNREAARGPRIVKVLNRTVGRWQNHLTLWVTLIALPGFWFIRIIEITSYWPLVVLLGFPKYKQSEWVNVSRHKFDGLVGHDLIWCLYCDWMTGVYSLGAEMLRNVESFWCPIRFYDGKKCENCRIDFPDLDGGWIPADGNMAQVAQKMEAMFADGRREWYGHPARLTVNGKAVAGNPNDETRNPNK